jgi:hypoxanthine phosphoribosyltransferase
MGWIAQHMAETLLALISIAGTVGTFYYGGKSFRLAQDKVRFSWDDVANACRHLRGSAVSRFKPQAVVCFSGPSAIVASILMEVAEYYAPMVVVFLEKQLGDKVATRLMPGYRRIDTAKWRLFIPEMLFTFSDKRTLLIDDCVVSGESLALLKTILMENGFSEIKTCSVVCTYIAQRSNRTPDYYCYLVDYSKFHMPWGEVY